MELPITFVERMQGLLGDDADAFFTALSWPSITGLRVNTLKLTPTQFTNLVPWACEVVSWCSAGLRLLDDIQPGKHPYHAAGLYYVQEPSAMAIAEILAPQPDELVLDLAAAPGGKATHLAALMGNRGVFVANEIERSRTRSLAQNLERWGARRAIISNETPQRLAEQWGAIFDRVLVDAPCSGEGMFRKSPTAVDEWSENAVQGCATRQKHLLETAARLVRVDGHLVYSTCTFAPEENEQIIAQFLNRHDDFALQPIRLPGSASGRSDWLPAELVRSDIEYTTRLWPHQVSGEGHFVALLRRTTGSDVGIKKGSIQVVSRHIRSLWHSFTAATLTTDPAEEAMLVAFDKHLYAIPTDAPPLDTLKVVRAGLWLGTLHRDRFEPSHSLALALQSADVPNRCDFAPDDERLRQYVQGHPLHEPGDSGWVLMTVAGFPIGWGRRAQGIIKNAYPKGLRVPG
ncbi:MAG: RsmF rRNA methyltransferase first C-terminal domain-containing protein [Chloroflexota bacterium]